VNALVAVGAVALLGFLGTMMGSKAEADQVIINGNGGAGLPAPGLPAPAPVLTATLNVETKTN